MQHKVIQCFEKPKLHYMISSDSQSTKEILKKHVNRS